LEGKLTYPLILLVKKKPEIKEKLDQIMRDGDYTVISRESVLELLEAHRTLTETREMAYSFADKARKNLDVLTETEYRLALEDIPGYMIERAK